MTKKNEHTTTPKGGMHVLCILCISLLPGAFLSLVLFSNAFYHDMQQQRYRNALPDTDLSLVRIEGRMIDDDTPYLQAEFPVNAPDEYEDDGTDNDVGTYRADIARDWSQGTPPLEPSDDEHTTQTPYNLTIDGVPMPDYETVLKTLNVPHNWIQGTRPLEPYSAFLDRTHHIELRVSYDLFGEARYVSMLRIDNRSTLAFLANRQVLSYDEFGLPGGSMEHTIYGDAVTDYGHYYGPKLFSHWELSGITDNLIHIFQSNRFLFYIREYFFIPLYAAAWLFPLVFAISKRRLRWFLPLIVWYPLWYTFCGLTYLALL